MTRPNLSRSVGTDRTRKFLVFFFLILDIFLCRRILLHATLPYQHVMSAIVKAVLTGTLGLLVKKGRQRLAEKLKDGDATDQQLRGWIIEEFDNVNSKLDAMVKSDLGASISFFNEGLVFLNKVKHSEASVDASAFEISSLVEERELSSAGVNTTSFVEGLRNSLPSPNLDKSAKDALLDAKARFKDARREATKAFNNTALTPSNCILAMAIRLMATILEKAENPADSLAVCIMSLKELHLTQFVKENFKVELTGGFKAKLHSDERRQIILSVCQLNRMIHDVCVIVREKGMLFNWPYIEIEKERVDPLRDSRVGKTLSELDMGECSVTWSFEKSAISVATNSCGQFLVVDQKDGCAVLDDMGKFSAYSFGPPAEEKNFAQAISAVATDGHDNVYLAVNKWPLVTTTNFHSVCQIYEFKHRATTSSPDSLNPGNEVDHAPLLKKYDFEAVGLMVVGDHLIVPGHESRDPTPSRKLTADLDIIEVYKRDGTRVGYISHPQLTRIRDITAVDDGRIMVLNSGSSVFEFDDVTSVHSVDDLLNPRASRFLREFSVTPKARAIAFHRETGHVIIVSRTSEERTQVLLYSKAGVLERGIDIALQKKVSIKAAAVTADRRICVTTGSKVLVL